MWQSFTEWLFTIMKCLIINDGKRHRNISVSGQLLETFWLLIIFQPMFIAQISGLHHSIAHCLVSLETKFRFCDAFRHRITVKILEHVISKLSDNETYYWTALLFCAFLRTNYWTGHQVLLITLLWVIGLFKDLCRKFSYVSTVSGKSCLKNSSRICFIN